jgi:hypothetical protein
VAAVNDDVSAVESEKPATEVDDDARRQRRELAVTAMDRDDEFIVDKSMLMCCTVSIS